MDFPITATRYDYVNVFINTLAPVVVNEVIDRKKNNKKCVLASVIIAQACLESGYNLNASTLFGIKGEGIELETQEYINEEYISIKDTFKYYPDICTSVKGYCDLMEWDNYDDVTSAVDYISVCKALVNDNGLKYATSPTYADNLISIISDYDLTAYDDYVSNYLEAETETETETETESETEETETEVLKLDDYVSIDVDSANCFYDINNTYCKAWYTEYQIIELTEDSAVIGINGVVTARVPLNIITKIGG